MKKSILAMTTTAALFMAVAPAAFAREGGMVRVEGGTFQMGCVTCCCTRPVRAVTVSGFYMGRFPVTQGEWYDVMGTLPSFFNGTNNGFGVTVTPTFQWWNLPVERVSWWDAVEFANALSRRAGLTPAYAISGTGATAR